MRTFLLVVLLAVAADGKAIRQRRAVSEYFDRPSIPQQSIEVEDNEDMIDSYKSVLESLLRQLSAIEQKNPSEDTSTGLLDDYEREYYTQAASEIVQKLIQYGALSAITDAEDTAFLDDTEAEESKQTDTDNVEKPTMHIGVRIVEAVPSTGSIDEESFTDEQAHEILKMIVEELMDKFFDDMKNSQNTHVYIIGGADSQQAEDEEIDLTEVSAEAEEEEEEGDSSSSSSSEEYYYPDSDEYSDVVIEGDDDAVLVVNKQVSTNIIRIPAATFVDALTKLLPSLKSDRYPAHLQKLTPLQVEDSHVYSEHGEPSLIGPKGPEPAHPHVSSHSVAPIASVPSPTAEAAAAPTTTKQTEYYHRAFDLGHVLLCFAAGLLCLWAIAQLVSMYRRRGQTAGPAPAMEMPPKVIPAIIPNIYATPPAVLTKTTDAEKPPVYVENPSFKPEETKPETKPDV